MLPNMNPKQMQKLMQQMGIKSEELDCKRATFELNDGTKLVIDNPNVVQVEMQGQKSFQVSGSVKEEAGSGAADAPKDEDGDEDDVAIIMKEAHVTRDEAQAALDAAGGDMAEAILKLQK